MPPVSKVMPLPTSATGASPFLPPRILEHDQARRLVRTAGDREERAHAEAPDLAFLEHARAHRLVRLRKRAGGIGEVARRADVRRQVCEVLHEGDAGGDADAFLDAALGGLKVRIRHDDAEARELRLRQLLRGLEVGNAIQGVVHAFDGVARGVAGIESRDAVAREPGRRARGTALREPLRRGEDCAPVWLAAETRFRPEPDQQDPLRGAAPDADDRESLRALAREVPALQDARDGAAARAVDPPRGVRQDPVLVDAYDRAGGPLARGSGLDCVKLHDPRSPACCADRRQPLSALSRWFTVSLQV